MTDRRSDACTAFHGLKILHSAPRLEVALAVKRALVEDPAAQVLVFEDKTGRIVDLDLRGSDAEIADRLSAPPAAYRGRFRPPAGEAQPAPDTPRGRGRPRMGVVSREVTLLPRHWEWLAEQRGGASAALRRLVDEARGTATAAAQQRAAREAAYNVLQAIAGDLPGYEEAIRALFAGDRPAFAQQMAEWPGDVRPYALRLAFAADTDT